MAATKRRRRQKKYTFHVPKSLSAKTLVGIYVGLVLASALMATVLALYRPDSHSSQSDNPFKDGQAQATAFTLYYPAHLPAGMHITPGSATTDTAGIVSLRVTDGAGSVTSRSLTISQQALPPGYNINTFNDSLANKTSVKTAYGQATIGTIDAGQSKLASLVADGKTLILIQAESGITNDDLVIIMQSLKPAAKPSQR